MKTIRSALSLLVVALPLLSQAGDGATITQEKCAGCHALAQPDLRSSGIVERSQRKAPPLWYAGNKFRQEWLTGWLQTPERLRPAGYYPPAHVTRTDAGDVVDTASLPEHLALSADEAADVSAYLMTLRGQDALIEQDSYKPGSVSLRMGMMDFRKFKGCNACHQDAPAEGGLSGPEVHTAWDRLQPAYISSYIKNPVAWDPHTMMPVQQMNDSSVHKLVNYLKVIGEK